MADAIIKLMDEVISDSLQDGIVHHFTEDQHLNGACFTINAQNMTNFASCSYLGLTCRHWIPCRLCWTNIRNFICILMMPMA